MWNVVTDTLIDAVKTLPFLLGAYWLIEYIEHRGRDHTAGLAKYGVLGGAFIGIVPQCGFSVAAANLYSRRIITVGTLIAVFLSTSDEALPLILSHPDRIGDFAAVIGTKVVLALVFGYAIDFFTRRRKNTDKPSMYDIHKECEKSPSNLSIFLAALRHTAFVFAFILAVMLALNIAVYLIGEDTIAAALMSHSHFQAVFTALFGLIPNCAPSIIMTELYLAGNLGFGSLMAGLLTGAGMGLLMLYRANRNMKENLLITLVLFLLGATSGIVINLISGTF